MNKNIIIIVLAIISVGSLVFAVSSNGNSANISPDEAKSKAVKFINEVLLQSGAEASIGDVIEENGVYKMALNLPDGTALMSYITKDGKILFPEGLNIEEVTNQLANANISNDQNQMELTSEILTEGSGEQIVKNGDTVSVDYTGTLEDGTQFDSSIGKTPFSFTVGQGEVIKGWDQGLIGMKVGEERKLTIPSNLAYGQSGAGQLIPPNATLIFTIKLISIN